MNIPLSLLIYNPIEVYTMILLCDIITGNRTKFSIKMIHSIYIFGAVNLAIQLVPCLFVGEYYFALLNILVGYFIVSISIKYFYGALYHKISYLTCVFVQFINTICIIITCNITTHIFGFNNMFYNDNNLHEFIVNIVAFSLQIVIYKFIQKEFRVYGKSF